jgi:hypothetical protein
VQCKNSKECPAIAPGILFLRRRLQNGGRNNFAMTKQKSIWEEF